MLLSTDLVNETVKEMAENPGVIKTYLQNFMPSLLSFLVQLLIALVVIWIGSRLIRWIVRIMKKALERSNAEAGVVSFLCSLVRYALYFVLGMIVLSQFGVTTGSVVAVLGSAGLTLGLALQGSLQNFAGGVLILILKPFSVGDYIIVDGSTTEGTVESISIYYTRLLTIDHRMIMVPNGNLSNSSITNVSKMDKRRLDLVVGVSYDTDLALAKKVLKEVVDKEKEVLVDEPIQIFVAELADSSVNLGVRVWVKNSSYWETKWRMTEKIKNSFDSNNISIPFPQLDVQIKQ